MQRGEWTFIGVFAGFFEGCRGKRCAFWMVFCGEIVVLRVGNVERERPYNRLRKMRHTFELFFGRTTCIAVDGTKCRGLSTTCSRRDWNSFGRDDDVVTGAIFPFGVETANADSLRE
jgi:hypothetical protein